MNTIGSRIKELRIEKKLTQKELATILSVPIPTLSHWECNYTEPSTKDILSLCRFFNVSSDYLIGLTDELGGVLMPGVMHAGASEFSSEEREFIEEYRAVPPDLREALWIAVRALNGSSNSASGSSPRKKA